MKLFGLDIKLADNVKTTDNLPAGNVVIGEGPHGIISDLDYTTVWGDVTTRFEKIEKMRRSDGRCGRTATMIKYPFLQADWWLEPANDSPEAMFIKEAVQYNMFVHMKTPWRTYVLPHALLSLEYGFSVFHKIFDEPLSFTAKEGSWHGAKNYTIRPWRKLAFRHPVSIEDRFELGQDGGLNAVRQILPQEPTETRIPAEEIIVVCPNREGDDWTGISIYRRAYKHFLIKEKLELLQAMAAERWALPFPVFTPENVTMAGQEVVDRCNEIAKKMRSHEQMWAFLPPGILMDILNPGRDLPDFTGQINYHNEQISSCMLQEFMDLSQTKSGARAVGQVQDDPFWAALQATAEQIGEPFVKYGIEPWVLLNFPDSKELVPKLKCSRIAPSEVGPLADGIAKLVQEGLLTPTPETEQHVRRELKFPQETKETIQKAQEERQKQALEAKQAAAPKPQDELAKKRQEKVDKHNGKVVKASDTWSPPRELKGAEAHVDWVGIKSYLDAAKDDLNGRVRPIRRSQSKALAQKIAKSVAKGVIPLNLGVPDKTSYAKIVREKLTEAYEYGKAQVELEVARQRQAEVSFAESQEHKEQVIAALALLAKKVSPEAVIQAKANALAETSATQLRTAGLREATRLIAEGADEEDAAEELEEYLDELSERDQGREGEKGVVVALSLGRAAAAAALLGLAANAQLSAVLDGNTCVHCWDADGDEVMAAEALTVEPFIFTGCAGITACRCIWVYSLL